MRIALIFSLLLCLSGTAPAAAMNVKVLEISGRQGPVSVRCYGEASSAKRPLVLLLHGQSGFVAFQSAYESYASTLVAQGNEVCAVLYYSAKDLKVMTKAKGEAKQAYYAERFGPWVDSVGEVTNYLMSHEGGTARQIGLLGFSQGGFLAIAVAGTNSKVAALVAAYGGIPTQMKDRLAHLPPTLILHGDADNVVPVDEAYAAKSFVKTRAPSVELRIYRGAKHGFRGADEKDARERIARFFGSHLAHR